MWPAVELYEARVPRAPRDLILAVGTEPSMRWRSFTKVIVELAEALGTQLVVTLGALLADVPHTHPVSVTGLASDPVLISRLGLSRSSYEGPTGIVGVLHAACQQAGLPSASLWAAVPHYVAATPNPKASLALVRKLEGLVGVAVDAGELEAAAAEYERQVNAAVQSDPDVQAFVERLEQVSEATRPSTPAAPVRRDDRPRPAAVPSPARRGPAELSATPQRPENVWPGSSVTMSWPVWKRVRGSSSAARLRARAAGAAARACPPCTAGRAGSARRTTTPRSGRPGGTAAPRPARPRRGRGHGRRGRPGASRSVAANGSRTRCRRPARLGPAAGARHRRGSWSAAPNWSVHSSSAAPPADRYGCWPAPNGHAVRPTLRTRASTVSPSSASE